MTKEIFIRLLFFIFTSYAGGSSYAQIGLTNNIGTNPIAVNPALTGLQEYGSLITNFTIVSLNNTRSNLSYQTYLPNINSGAGLIMENSSIGDYRAFTAGLTFSHQAELSQNLNFSVGAGAFHKNNRNVNNSVNYMQVNAGIVLSGKRFFISSALNKYSIEINRMTFLNAMGYKFKIKKIEELYLIPTITTYAQSNFTNTSLRLNVNYKKINLLVGAARNSLVAGFGYQKEKWRLHYIGNLSYSSLGSGNNILRHRISFQVSTNQAATRPTSAFDFELF